MSKDAPKVGTVLQMQLDMEAAVPVHEYGEETFADIKINHTSLFLKIYIGQKECALGSDTG